MKKRELLRRIEALEARVRDLEARPLLTYTTAPPIWVVPMTYPSTTIPSVFPWSEITCTSAGEVTS